MTTVTHHPTNPQTRTPPHDLQAEQAVLGSMLLSSTAAGEALEHVTGGEFYQPAHEAIFDTMAAMYAAGEAIDGVTLHAALQRNGRLAQLRNGTYITDLMANTPSPASVDYYAGRVRELATKRRMAETGRQVVQLAMSVDAPAKEVVDRAQSAVFEVDPYGGDTSEYVPAGQLAQDTIDYIEALSRGEGEARLSTGLADLDSVLGGLAPGQLAIVGARPGMGKSVLGADIARSAGIHHNVSTLLCSLEMSRTEIMMRLLSAESSVDLNKLKSGDLDERDWERLGKGMNRFRESSLYVTDTPATTPLDVASMARRVRQRHGSIGLIVVDYVQLMHSSKSAKENRQTEVADFSRQLKLLAKELDVPVVALAQLNRGPEHQADKKPSIAHLRESGALEQDADMVLLLHREDANDHESERPGEADIIVAKHRNGPTGTITFAFQGHYSRFADLAKR